MDVQVPYRSIKLESSSSDSDSDSNDDSDVWKRHSNKQTTNDENDQIAKPAAAAAVLPASHTEGAVGSSRKRKVNSIWSNVLEEETVVGELCQIGLKAKLPDTQNRTCESYDFTLKYSDPRREQDMDTDSSSRDTPEDSVQSDDSKERVKLKKSKKYRSSESLDSYVKKNKYHGKYKWKADKDEKERLPNLSPSDIEVARKIVRTLGERKHYLIYRVVHVIGADKSIQLLRMTEDIENDGGMFVKNNTRRRTPGGVYLQLLKSDKNITPEQINEIFAHEIPFEKYKEYRKFQKKLYKQKGGVRQKKKKKRCKEKVIKDEDDGMICEESPTVASAAVPKTEAAETVTKPPSPSVPPVIGLASYCALKNGDSEGVIDSDLEDGEIIDT